jgi:prefoldin alpha subunit
MLSKRFKMSEISTNEKVLKYESFVNEKLRKDISIQIAELDEIYSEIGEYLQLKDTIEKISELDSNNKYIKTKVDIGCNFYANAVVRSDSKIFVAIGFGFFLELTLSEAVKFVDRKIIILKKRVDELKIKISEIKADIRFVMEGLKEIQNIHLSTDKERINLF